MCSIIASKDIKKFKDLILLNQSRGNFSYSISEINDKYEISTIKKFGICDVDSLELNNESIYYIAHVQAPTNGLINDKDRIHPTKINNSCLWHNGLVKQKGIEYLQTKYNTQENFDTKLLHLAMNDNYNLSNIEGLFTLLYFKDGVMFFLRTKHGQLYIDDDYSISSLRFKNSKCINYDTVYSYNIKETLTIINKFKTKRFNIIIKGEL